MSDQPEALRLANFIAFNWTMDRSQEVATELRRQHAEIERLREYADMLVSERNAAWAESADLRKDAGRYRHLREYGTRGCTEKDGYGEYSLIMGSPLDDAVDAAMRAK